MCSHVSHSYLYIAIGMPVWTGRAGIEKQPGEDQTAIHHGEKQGNQSKKRWDCRIYTAGDNHPTSRKRLWATAWEGSIAHT